MDLARFVGELVADIVAVGFDLLADFEQGLAQLGGYDRGFGDRCDRGHARRRGRFDRGDLAAVALLTDTGGHQRLADLHAAAGRAFDRFALQLAVAGGAVLEPGFETVLPIAIELVKNHDPGRLNAVTRICLVPSTGRDRLGYRLT